jgi:predicted transcriptional regulator
METLHLRADSNTLEAVMSIINQFAQSGQTIEVLDNVTYNREQAMIFQGLAEERQGQLINHKDLWADLLET